MKLNIEMKPDYVLVKKVEPKKREMSVDQKIYTSVDDMHCEHLYQAEVFHVSQRINTNAVEVKVGDVIYMETDLVVKGIDNQGKPIMNERDLMRLQDEDGNEHDVYKLSTSLIIGKKIWK